MIMHSTPSLLIPWKIYYDILLNGLILGSENTMLMDNGMDCSCITTYILSQ